MGASPLGPEESDELAELRRRAYGPDAGIVGDPAAQARLEELERLVRSGVAVAPQPESISEAVSARDLDAASSLAQGAAPAPAPDRGASGLPVSRGSSSSAPEGAPPVEPPTERRQNRNRRVALVLGVVVAALFGGVVSGFAVAAASAPPQPSASTTPTPVPAVTLMSTLGPMTEATLAIDLPRTRQGLLGLSVWAEDAGFDTATLIAYQKVGSLTPWTAERWNGREHCVLLQPRGGEGFSHIGCARAGTAWTLGVVVTEDSEVRGATQLPVDALLMFVDHNSEIEVHVALP